jgi:high-affinity nickel-transport protein
VDSALNSLSSLLLLFFLGLRYGLDQDHVAYMDGSSWRALNDNPKSALRVGPPFALGHGLLVTAIAIGVSLVTQQLSAPDCDDVPDLAVVASN